ncbi:unnamed protein product [Effrenium voratum]|uniref:Uncharacterized protein n=1 Tax=Effrenium voratum TaxID=2562239 RepID=A0AA36HRV7_9DINO|nr:unnamed protein product [Effrenium voratum]CAJ1452379.1 unnamed protein product [Effrenium voratum]
MSGVQRAELAAPLFAEGSGPEASAAPEDAAWCLARVTFSWVGAIISEGYQRERRRAQGQSDERAQMSLTDADLLALRSDDEPTQLSQAALEAWQAEPQDQKSLARVLRRAFGAPFMFAAFFKLLYDTLQMVGPYILKDLLNYLGRCGKPGESCELGTGMALVALMLASAALQTSVLHQYFHRCFRTGMRFNAACISLVYHKALRLGPGADAGKESQRTSGEIVNLMAVDSQRLQDTTTYLHTLWSGPYQIVITLIFLHWVVGWATVAGVMVMLLQIPAVTVVARRIRLAQRALMSIKDERIKVTNEAFGSIRLLKMYGWEDSFEARLDGIRERELKQLRKYQILNIISSAMWATAPILTALATFAVYSALYGELTPATAFTAVSLFNVLRFPLTMFPNTVTSAVEAKVALRRLEEFLCSPEITGRVDNPGQAAIIARSADLKWPNGTVLLSPASFTVPAPGQAQAHLTVILGAVGAGKSGLLQAIIGDLSPVAGELSVSGSIAYVPQVSWIRNATLKDNIIFNSQFEEDRYHAVLKACCLLPDLESLPNGDLTEIGEKGVNLSGGQKQRISLARAVYSQADLLLLDDPLSAVDSHVAKSLLKMFRSPLLAKSSIVLCTHHVQAVQSADQILVISKGLEVENSLLEDSEPREATGTPQVVFCGSLPLFRERFPKLTLAEASPALARQVSEEVGMTVAKSTEAGKLVQKEEEQLGSVPADVYSAYIQAAGGWCLAVTVLSGVLCGQGLQAAASAWISYWSDHSSPQNPNYVSSSVGLIGYTGLSLTAFLGIFLTSALFRLTALKAARTFHRRLLTTLLRLPMTFFDTTPLGRVLNRFSKDIYTVDEVLQNILYSYLQVVSAVICTIVVISFATPWFLVLVIPLLYVYRATQNYYIPASRQLKRIESNLRSPIFSHFSETLDGTALIRAYGQQRTFVAENMEKVSRNMRAYYSNFSSNRWLAVRLETIGALITCCAGTLAVLGRHTISAGVAGLSVSYALSVTQALNWVVRMAADRETSIVSVERIREYLNLDLEPPHHLPSDPTPNSWPREGSIEFQDIFLRYRPELPTVLNGLSLEVRAREKIGICGRTGAGKSSVLNVLLRIVEIESGRVLLDGLDINTLGLHCLRHSMTVIPQDPILFSGTLRFNLDPLSESNDQKLWQALQRSHLADHISTLESEGGPSGLDAVVQEQGKNFSLGQRQQMCLARALTRSNSILLLDEATSAVDRDTDELIQGTIKTEFKDHTVLCIAHRISTIMYSDRVCVLDAGKLAEIGPPQDLIKNAESRFAKLAAQDAMA